MRRILTSSLQADGYGPLLPFVIAALLFVITMQAKLMPFKPAAIEFPPAADVAATSAVLPQFSVAPSPTAEGDNRQTAVLPSEAVPDAQPPGSAEPSVAMTAPNVAGSFGAEGVAPALPAGRLPSAIGVLLGAGNIHLRTSRSSPLSSLATNLMLQIKRLHPVPQTAAKRPPTIEAQRPARASVGVLAQAGLARPAASGLAGAAAPLTGVLGGPSASAAKYAPVIDGTTLRRRF